MRPIVCVSDRSPALWRLAGAAVIDAAPAVATVAVMVLRVRRSASPSAQLSRAELAERMASGYLTYDVVMARAIGGASAQQRVRRSASPSAQLSPPELQLAKRIMFGVLAYDVALAGAMAATGGRTPGTALLGLKLVRSDGTPIGIIAALVRRSGVARLCWPMLRRARKPGTRSAAEGALATLNASSALIHPQRRTLNDLAAGTRVVRSQRKVKT